MKNLDHFFLWGNELTGPIPPEIGQLSKMINLDFGKNRLTGPLPRELGQLTQIEVLYMNKNQLTGCIPAELGLLLSLTRLQLSENQLCGSVPQELGNLTNLIEFNISSNQLSGTIPESLYHLGQGCSVDIGNNYFTESDALPAVWRKKNAFQEFNIMPRKLIDALELEYISEEHTLVLTRLDNMEAPTLPAQWTDMGIPIGFPDNPVWNLVAQAVETVPERLHDINREKVITAKRVQELKAELQVLQDRQVKWQEVEEPMRKLEERVQSFISLAQRLRKAEETISQDALANVQTHTPGKD